MSQSERLSAPSSSKAMTLRLPVEMTEELELVARVRGIPMTHVVRLAVARHLAHLTEDDVFQARLHRTLEDERRMLERFARVEPAGAPVAAEA